MLPRNIFLHSTKLLRPRDSCVLPGSTRHFVLPPPVVPNPAHPYPKMKVTILGASGGIGQPLALLLKHSTILTDLNVYDLEKATGVAVDLSHIETRVRVKGFNGPPNLNCALEDADIVVIPAGLPRKPGMTREDLFKTNATIMYELIHAVAKICPLAVICIISNPVNSMVPIAGEVLRNKGVFDPQKLFGITTLDVVRANSFIAEAKKIDPAHVYCPVVGGHSGVTIIPLLSQCIPKMEFTPEETAQLTERIQEAGNHVIQAKAGAGSATLSIAYASARFVYSLMRAFRGESGIKECAYVKTDAADASYFASNIVLGANGMEENLGVGTINSFEKELVKKALPDLKKDIERGEKFAREKIIVID